MVVILVVIIIDSKKEVLGEYAKRRQVLWQAMEDNSIAILSAQNEVIRNGDAHFPYRQGSNFYYLTGFEEPESVMVLLKEQSHCHYILFSRPLDPKQERWTGKRVGQRGAMECYGADDAYPIDQLEEQLSHLLEDKNAIYYPIARDAGCDETIMRLMEHIYEKQRKGIGAPEKIVNIETILHPMRLIKSEYEIEMMQKAADISVAAHRRAMTMCRPGLYEYQIEAEILHEFHGHGCPVPAYPSIVASGENGCILHYIENNAVVNDGDLLLIDAGAEYQNYAADITRTFPANGRFTQEQRAIYELVLDAQLSGIQVVKPGVPWPKIQEIIVEILTQGLLDLGILQGKFQDLIANQSYNEFYMHNSGHWLGLDVHDAGPYKKDKQPIPLQPGMVLTVEPGIYIDPNNHQVDEKWHGIAVRIEDDVLVTAQGHCVLSGALPKTVEKIESLMNHG